MLGKRLPAVTVFVMLAGFLTVALAPALSGAESGKVVYEKNCSGCHGADGTGNPPAVPSLADADLSVAAIESAIRKNDTHAFLSESIRDEQLVAIAEYLLSL